VVAEREFTESLAGRIKRVLLLRGLSQGTVARSIGGPRTSLIQIERAKQRVSAYQLLRFAEVLEIDAADLLAVDGGEAAETLPGLESAPPGVVEFVTRARAKARANERTTN
jgi:transcriptional regulator with XRE-family HTH domain